MAETVETAIYRLRVEGQDQIDRATRSVEGLATAEDKLASSNRTTSAQIQRGIAQYDPLIRQQEKYLAAMKQIENARERGTASESQLTTRLELEKKALNDATVAAEHLRRTQANAQITPFKSATESALVFEKAINQVEKATISHTNATKLQGYQMLNLSRQIQDIGVSLFGGQSPLTVAVQQIPQIADISQQSGVSLTNMFKQAGAAALGFLTPMRLVVGGLGAIGVGAATMAVESFDNIKEMQRSLIGLGARTGTTVADIKNFAKENASATGPSISQMRSLGMEMTKTGEISIKSLHGMGDAVQGFAALIDTDFGAAGKKLTQLFSGDLDKAVDELSKTYSDFNPTIRENVRLLELQGNRGAATQLIVNTMAESNRKAAETTGFWTKAVNALGNAYDAVKNKVQPVVAPDLTATPGRLATAQQHLEMVQRPELGFSADEIRVAREEVEKLNAELAKTNTKNAQAAFNDLANKAEAATRSFDPYIAQIEAVERKLADLKRAQETIGLTPEQAGAQQGLQNQLQALREAQAQTARYNQRVTEIAGSWGNVGQATALALQAAQNNLPVIKAVSDAAKMAAQYTADYNNAMDAGKSATEAAALAASNLAAAHAAATTNVLKQVEALKDSTEMIKAQTEDLGTGAHNAEMMTAASIAYKNAIESGASSAAAAALSSETIANYMAKAAYEAAQMQIANDKAAESAIRANQALHGGGGGTFTPDPTLTTKTGVSIETAPSLRLDYEQAKFLAQSAPSFADQVAAAGAGGVQAALAFAMAAQPRVAGTSAQPGMYPGGSVGNVPGTEFETTKAVTEQEILSQVGSLYDLMNQQTTDKAAQATNLQSELRWLQSRPTSIAQQQQIAQLRQSIEGLTKSTDSLNATNQELLSPFYTQDPRTSHIGFRSQGMAAGGYIDVPGSPSANDNMTAIIPVASGERIYVDPMTGRRGAAGSNLTINISSPVLIQGNANKDDVGRTMFQNNQNLAKQLRSAMQ